MFGLVVLALALACGLPKAAAAPPPLPSQLGLIPGYDDPQPAFAWQGSWQSEEVRFPSKSTGAELYATVFAPTSPPPSRLPAVVLIPGCCVGVQAQYQWSARDLAGHGYVALTVDPQGQGKSAPDTNVTCGPGPPPYSCAAGNYLDALESAIDFLTTSSDPYGSFVNPAEIGAAGHSEGAATVSYAQSADPRIKVIVAWDNLFSSPNGDQGAANCANAATTPIAPRVPAMGQASDGCTNFPGHDRDVKKTAYEHWRSAGLPTMEVVFNGAQHTDWAQEDNVPSVVVPTGTEQQLRKFEYYTRAWFDLFLRHDTSAASRLLASTVNGRGRNSLLSSQFRSAAHLPSLGIDCEDLLACALPAPRVGESVQVVFPRTPRCRTRRHLTIRLIAPRHQRIVQVTVYVNRRRLKAFRERHIRRITLYRLPAGRLKLELRVRTNTGIYTVKHRTYRDCAPATSTLRRPLTPGIGG